MSTDRQLGPLLRLWGLQRSQLPSPTASASELTAFITSLLSEAVPFIDSVPSAPSSPSSSDPFPWKPISTKSFPASAAPVRLLQRHIPASSLPAAPDPTRPRVRDEIWACRVSVHDDSPTAGTASFREFRTAIKDAHWQTEEAFTPSVVAAREAITWDSAAASVPPVVVGAAAATRGHHHDHGGDDETRWGRFTLGVVEMRHAVGRPLLKDRVFPVLQLTASALDSSTREEGGGEEKDEFVVVSVTVDDFARAEEAELSKQGDVVVARYVSVERVRKRLRDGKIEWVMATASDARGNLPAWVQKGAVPGQIAKDVALFLGWIAGEREKQGLGERKKDDGSGDKGGDEPRSGKPETVVAREQEALRKGMGAGGGAALQ